MSAIRARKSSSAKLIPSEYLIAIDRDEGKHFRKMVLTSWSPLSQVTSVHDW
jgi:hypothetical protein